MTDSSDSSESSSASLWPDAPLQREDVEEHRDLFRRILDAIPTAVFIKDRDGRYLLMNRACRDLLGLAYDRDVSDMRVEEFFAEDQSNQINELESELWQRSEAISAKNVYETTDGRQITILTRKAPVADDAGASSVMFAVATDVSGHVRNEERLADQAHELRERVKEVSCLYDISRTLLECEGTITSDVLGRIARRIPAGWQYPQITEARVQLGDEVGETSGFRQTDWMLHHHTGEGSLRAAVDVAYIESDEHDGPTFIPEERQLLESIVERLAEAGRRARAEEQVRFQARLLDLVGESVIATDTDGRVIYWNRASENIYGWSADEAIGQRIVDLTPSERMRDAAGDIMESLYRGETWSGEFEVRRKQGGTFTAQITNVPVVDTSGELVGIVGVSRDLTRVKALEAKLQQAQKLEALGRLAGGIAHDFNNMLTAIRGNAQLLAMDAQDADTAETVAEIDKAATRAAELTSQLLAFSRRQLRAPRVLSVNTAISEMESMLRRLLGDQVALTFEYDDDAGNVRADPTQLHQLLMNLVVNARDAILGSGEIAVRVASTVVEDDDLAPGEAPSPGEYVAITVSDSGEGMDERTRRNVFEPFFTTKREGEGTGLGLSTVYGIVKQSDGYIDVESELGEGTTFRVLLPRVFEPADEESSDVLAEASSVDPERTILICEDEDSVRRFTRRTLERYGFRVVVADSGQHALELFEREETIDMVITDVVMPQMSGLELLDELRDRNVGVPILLVSGYAKPEILEGRDCELGDSFLHKPFNATELIERVSDLIE